MSNRVSQLPVEVLILSDVPISARLSQLPVEVLLTNVALEPVKKTPPGRGNAATTTVTFTPAPSIDNGIIILVHGYKVGGAVFGPSACVDNQGNTYTLAITQANATGENAVAVYYCSQILFTGTPFNITITFSVSTFFTTVATEVAGPIELDKTASNTGSTAAVSAGTTAGITKANELITAIQSTSGGSEASIVVQTVVPPWFEEFEDLVWGSHLVGEANSRVVTNQLGVAQTCAWTNATARQYCAAIATFKIPDVVASETTNFFISVV